MDQLSQQYQELQDRHQALRQEILDKDNRRNGLNRFIRELRGMSDSVREFDPIAFRVLVERVTV